MNPTPSPTRDSREEETCRSILTELFGGNEDHAVMAANLALLFASHYAADATFIVYKNAETKREFFKAYVKKHKREVCKILGASLRKQKELNKKNNL